MHMKVSVYLRCDSCKYEWTLESLSTEEGIFLPVPGQFSTCTKCNDGRTVILSVDVDDRTRIAAEDRDLPDTADAGQ